MSARQKSDQVTFVGGELDGKLYVLPELKPRYYVPYCRQRPNWSANVDLRLGDAVPFGETEYVLTEKNGVFYYIESELMRLSNAQGFDPRP